MSKNDISETPIYGKIPIRNLWVLMLYASDYYQLAGTNRVGIEENSEELGQLTSLLARIFCDQLEKRLKRNLNFGYQRQQRVLNRVRGRIDLLQTERQHLLAKGKVACRFEELSIDTDKNRYLCAALARVATLVEDRDIAHRCKSLVFYLERLGIRNEKPVGYSSKGERLGLHDQKDRTLLALADLIFLMVLPTQIEGNYHLKSPDNAIRWLRNLFEKAILGFYRVNLDNSWRVKGGTQLRWQLEDKTKRIDRIFPQMKLDILLENERENRKIIIDTKFNSLTVKGYRREETLRSAYIYQLYAYLQSQNESGEENLLNREGVLLHPSIDEDWDESAMLQGDKIRFYSVNLAGSTKSIQERLKQLIEGE